MPRAFAISAVSLLCVVGMGPPAKARGAAWRAPVPGPVIRAFSHAEPFARGAHRNVVFAAPPGTLVRSVCAGTVAFAGPVGRAGSTIGVVCGGHRATYQGIAAPRVHRGDRVTQGAPLARAGRSGNVRLGARVESPEPIARYTDPMALIAAEQPPSAEPPRLGPAPRSVTSPPRPGPGPHPTADPPHRGPAPRPVASPLRPAPRLGPSLARDPEERPGLPLAAYLGLAAIAAAIPVPALSAARRRRRRPIAANPVGSRQ